MFREICRRNCQIRVQGLHLKHGEFESSSTPAHGTWSFGVNIIFHYTKPDFFIFRLPYLSSNKRRVWKMRVATLLASWATLVAAGELIPNPTSEEFQTLLQKHERLLVSFSSYSLDSVRIFNDLFFNAATNRSTPFVGINCDVEASLCKSYDINAFPTIRLFERNQEQGMEIIRYRGPRTRKAIHSFVKKRELPILSQLEATDRQFRRIDSIVFIALLAPNDEAHLGIYTAIAKKHHFDFVFGYTTDVSIAEKEDVQVPSIICYRNNDRDNLLLEGPFTYDDVENFLLSAKDSMIRHFHEKDIETFMQRDKLTVYIFLRDPEDIKARRELAPIAKKYERFITFATVDTGRYGEMPQNFGIEMKGQQAMVVHAPMNDNVFFYKQSKKIEEKVVEKMLETILQGKASVGQVFGAEAEDVEGGYEGTRSHDEL
jgi:protein disulfide-isomerase A1